MELSFELTGTQRSWAKSVRGGGGGEVWKEVEAGEGKLKGFSEEDAAEEVADETTVEEEEKISSLEKSRRSSIGSKSGEDRP